MVPHAIDFINMPQIVSIVYDLAIYRTIFLNLAFEYLGAFLEGVSFTDPKLRNTPLGTQSRRNGNAHPKVRALAVNATVTAV
ncbi:hypothetical protein V8C42DRAFT_337382 [Trichoderma barbatum]